MDGGERGVITALCHELTFTARCSLSSSSPLPTPRAHAQLAPTPPTPQILTRTAVANCTFRCHDIIDDGGGWAVDLRSEH